MLLWGYRSGKLWVFTLCAAGGFSLLYFTGTRLTYFGAILLAGGFFVLVLLGRKRWVFCLPLAVALALLVAFQGMSPMAARQAMSVDSDSYYEELTQQYLGEDSDFVYQEGEEIPPEILEKIRALYTEVYGKRGIYNTMLLGDLIQEFGVDRVMEEYGYTVDGELLYDVRDKKLHALHLVWEDQDLFTTCLALSTPRPRSASPITTRRTISRPCGISTATWAPPSTWGTVSTSPCWHCGIW